MSYFNVINGEYDSDRHLVKWVECGTNVGDVYDGMDPATLAAIASGDLSPICDSCRDKELAGEGLCSNCGSDEYPLIAHDEDESPLCVECQSESVTTEPGYRPVGSPPWNDP